MKRKLDDVNKIQMKHKRRKEIWQSVISEGEALYAGCSSQYISLLQCIQGHHEYASKTVKGVKAFKVIFDPKWKTTYLCLIIHSDNSHTDISIASNKAYSKRTSHGLMNRSDLMKVMRDSVDDQIVSYKRENHDPRTSVCPVCTSLIPWGKSHVDHVLHFSHLLDEFLKTFGNPSSAFQDKTDGNMNHIGGIELNDADIDYRKSWESFHRERATLRLLCGPCNLARGNSD